MVCKRYLLGRWCLGASGPHPVPGEACGTAAVNKTLRQSAPPARAPLADAQLARAFMLIDQGAPMSEIAADVQKAVDLGKSDAWETVGWRLLDHHRHR